ncbi:MAG: MarR family transcriptional regulator [Geodermatophilaceae bacterium]|nr:MarR family transcriptional regulator [Geodermatophilaceae bacterium]MDQ3476171.1 MarR family transcriptional regulator [Actinomycetota bacterium]
MHDGAELHSAVSTRLDPTALASWRVFLRAHAVVTRHLEAELLEDHDLPLASYDVLVQLVDAPGRRLRMTELASAVLLSRSGLSRLVDRLQREGLVTREAASEDGRGMYAVLQPAGLSRLRTAAPTHLRGVAEHMTSKFSDAELDALRALLDRLCDGPLRLTASAALDDVDLAQ